jgi:hypothetical protein
MTPDQIVALFRLLVELHFMGADGHPQTRRKLLEFQASLEQSDAGRQALVVIQSQGQLKP